jgi:hypothetical protein
MGLFRRRKAAKSDPPDAPTIAQEPNAPEPRDSVADGLDAAARALAARRGAVVDNVNVDERE